MFQTHCVRVSGRDRVILTELEVIAVAYALHDAGPPFKASSVLFERHVIPPGACASHGGRAPSPSSFDYFFTITVNQTVTESGLHLANGPIVHVVRIAYGQAIQANPCSAHLQHHDSTRWVCVSAILCNFLGVRGRLVGACMRRVFPERHQSCKVCV